MYACERSTARAVHNQRLTSAWRVQFEFLSQNQDALKLRHNVQALSDLNAFNGDQTELIEYQRVLQESKNSGKKHSLDTMLSRFSPQSQLGVVSERFSSKLEQFLATHPEVDRDLFTTLMHIKYHARYGLSIFPLTSTTIHAHV